MSRRRAESIDRIIVEGTAATHAAVRIASDGGDAIDHMLAEFLLEDEAVDTSVQALRELVPVVRPSDVPTVPEGRGRGARG